MKKKYAQMQQHIVKIIYNDILCVTLTKRNIKRICAELSFVNVWRGSLQLTKYLPVSHCTYCKDLLLFNNVHVFRHKFREVLHSFPMVYSGTREK